MKILVRAPNWLGDVVMSSAFFAALRACEPNAEIHAVIKDTLADLAEVIPGIDTIHRFSVAQMRGIRGAFQCGRHAGREGPFDYFYSLPDSLSAALMGYFSRSRERTGYAAQGRSLLLTNVLHKKNGIHRVDEYAGLLEKAAMPAAILRTHLKLDGPVVDTRVIAINCNSEAPSRRMSLPKWAEVISGLIEKTDCIVTLIGSPRERDRCRELAHIVNKPDRVVDQSGQTDLPALARLLASAKILVTGDSGPAHLANALGTPVVVLFGAGDDHSTAPFNKENLAVIRLGNLPCAPCVSNTCRFGDQRCLERLDTKEIVRQTIKILRQ